MTGLIAVMVVIALQSVSEAPATSSATAPVAAATTDVNGKPWPPPGVHRRGQGVVFLNPRSGRNPCTPRPPCTVKAVKEMVKYAARRVN